MIDPESCRDMEDRIILMVDGELREEEEAELLEHLAACARCRRVLEEHRRLREVLGELPQSPTRSIARRLGEVEARIRSREKISRLLKLAASLAVAAGLSWFSYRTTLAVVERKVIRDLPVVEDLDTLAEAGGADLLSDMELVDAVLELSQETIPEDF